MNAVHQICLKVIGELTFTTVPNGERFCLVAHGTDVSGVPFARVTHPDFGHAFVAIVDDGFNILVAPKWSASEEARLNEEVVHAFQTELRAVRASASRRAFNPDADERECAWRVLAETQHLT